LSQLKTKKELLNQQIIKHFFSHLKKPPTSIISLSITQDNIAGPILKREFLANFSIKLYKALVDIDDLFTKNIGTGFIYFNLVKIGVDLFAQILLENGFLEYKEDRKYFINDDTKDSLSGLLHKDFISLYPNKTFYPATFIVVKGTFENNENDEPEIKKEIIDEVFSNVNNSDGKYIKLLIGSRVMNEGVTLENVRSVFILDVYYNIGKPYQAIGRALRECKHYKITNDNNKYPSVNIYKYAVTTGTNELSSE
jgi:hypothetical protein